MCGINGFNFKDDTLLDNMNLATHHRGPEGTGIFSNEFISLGQNRLAIIELSDLGKQPMSNHDENVWITFNGEIYNFQDIRRELENKYKFKSHSDTEVIIYAYEEWGTECVKKLKGMWAFCIYDKKKQILFLSRDRFGEKPLHYYYDGKRFIFSSETKAIFKHNIKKELSSRAISSYLSYRQVLGEETFFKNVKKLMPAHNILFDLKQNKIISIKEYWDLQPQEIKVEENKAASELERHLTQSIRYCKISDVPLGIVLSGGLDSSIITAILAKMEKNPINTFTVKFKEKGYDETEFAKIVAEQYNANYFEVLLETKGFLGMMEEYSSYKDEPIGVPNEVALYLLSKKIKEKVTVVLSGEGADEIFEGYGRKFSSARDYEIIKSLIKSENGENVYKEKFSNLYNKYAGKMFNSEMEHFLFEYGYWTEDDIKSVLLPSAHHDFDSVFKDYFDRYEMSYQKKIAYLFAKLHLPGLLARLDSATMASAVEARAPFLDYELAEYIFSLPSDLKTKWNISKEEVMNLNKTGDELSEKDNVPKYLLKKVSKQYLPNNIVDRVKQGFPLPLSEWFVKDFKEIAKEKLLSKESRIKPFVDQNKLSLWLEGDPESKRFGQKVWMLLSLEIWLRRHFG